MMKLLRIDHLLWSSKRSCHVPINEGHEISRVCLRPGGILMRNTPVIMLLNQSQWYANGICRAMDWYFTILLTIHDITVHKVQSKQKMQ